MVTLDQELQVAGWPAFVERLSAVSEGFCPWCRSALIPVAGHDGHDIPQCRCCGTGFEILQDTDELPVLCHHYGLGGGRGWKFNSDCGHYVRTDEVPPFLDKGTVKLDWETFKGWQ